jgi:hypothetical protein
LPDCTHTPTPVSLVALLRLLAGLITILALIAAWPTGLARADGDPASDVLATQNLLLPQDAAVPASQQAQLGALLQAAGHAGYQIRVAVIASQADLGSVTELWHQPHNYARFLGQELSRVYTGPLLVIMPDGYGLYRSTRPAAGEQTALASLPAPGAQLGTAALTAIQRLAAAASHTLALPSATAPSNPSSTDTIAWLVFAVGGALITVACTASLHARPLRTRRNRTTPT